MIDETVLPDDTPIYRWGEVRVARADRMPAMVGPSLVVWAPESPFGVPGVDCRSVSMGALSAATELEVVHRFDEVVNSTVQDWEGQRPEGAQTMGCRLVYPELDVGFRGPLFTPEVFEDRWVIHQGEGALYFVNTWGEGLVLVAEWRAAMMGVSVERVWAAAVRGPSMSPAYAVRQVDFLLKSHVFDRWCPHPIPPELGHDAEAIAHDAWITYGHRGYFGTHADTTAMDLALKVWPKVV